MKEEKIKNLIESYELALKNTFPIGEDWGFFDGKEQTLRSVIEDLKDILDNE